MVDVSEKVNHNFQSGARITQIFYAFCGLIPMFPSSEISIQKQILEELQQSEARFRAIFENSACVAVMGTCFWACRKIVQFLLAEDDFDQLFQGLIGTGNSP